MQLPPSGPGFVSVAAGSRHDCSDFGPQGFDCRDSDEQCFQEPNLPEVCIGPSGYAGHICAIDTEGTIECWGNDEYGQATPPAGRYTDLALGRHHSCALRENGSVVCWGGSTEDTQVPFEERFVHIAAGEFNTCGITTEGRFLCWGSPAVRL
ncbi:MAG: hypothetical protein P8R42_11410 [Candidatus Binatia bacterium]|nr:hypothetical protein [Candidatus Binatia bacterium]